MDKRHFTVVIGSNEHGLYVSSKPSSAAKKAVSKLCASNKSKKVEFCLREITQDSKKKTYGPYFGEMKKLKTPIELKGRVIRHEIKVHLKKGKRSTMKTSKKMRGGEEIESNEPIIPLNTEIEEFRNFIVTHFPNNSGSIKTDILQRIRSMSQRGLESRKCKQYFFYVYRTNPKPNKIISVGAIPEHNIEIKNNMRLEENYLFIGGLLSRERGNRGGTSAIYHILLKLPPIFCGICLSTTPDAFDYYRSLRFTINKREDNMLKLDKNESNMKHLISIIKRRGEITTEFYSNCPFLNYTEDELRIIREKIKHHKNLRTKNKKKHNEKITSNKKNDVNKGRRRFEDGPLKLNQYWNPDKQKWISPNYSRIEKSRNEIARELLRRKFMSKK